MTYQYVMNAKLSQIGNTPMISLFPNVEDIIMSSKSFDEFDDAVNSANAFCMEFTKTANTAVKAERYSIISEINPKSTGQETISKTWAVNELAKIWVVDKIRREQNPGPIHAVSLTQIIEIPETPTQH